MKAVAHDYLSAWGREWSGAGHALSQDGHVRS
jgi:hypothetical protein